MRALNHALNDPRQNRLLRDLGIAGLFLAVAILFQVTPLSATALVQQLVGVCVGFALGYGIRSAKAALERRRQ